MAKTLVEVQKQIAELRAMEEELRRSEAQGVISRIREAIAVYGFTPADLFGKSANVSKGGKAKSVASGVKFADGTGNTWSGRGPRPQWLRDALATGRSIDEFAADGTSAPSSKANATATSTSSKAQGASPKAGKKVAIKYRDGANTWSGRGSQPRWLKEALAGGKSITDFSV